MRLQMRTLKPWENINPTTHTHHPMRLLNQPKQLTPITLLNTLRVTGQDKTQLLPPPTSSVHLYQWDNTTAILKIKTKRSPRMTTWEESPSTTTLPLHTHPHKITHSIPATLTCLGMFKTPTNHLQQFL